MYCDAYINEKKMWYFDNKLQALCEWNLDSYEVEVLKRYCGRNSFLANRVFKVENVLYITDFVSLRILKFDMAKYAFEETIDEKINVPLSEEKTAYVYSMLYDKKIWFFPRYKTTLTCYFDLLEEQFYWDDSLNRAIDEYVTQKEMAITYSMEYGSQLWATVGNTHRYLKYDLYSDEVTIFELDNKDIHLNSICFDGECVWLTQINSTDLICVDDEEYIIRVEGDLQENQYTNIVNLQDDIIVLPRYGESIILIDKNTRTVRKMDMPRKYFIGGKIETGPSLIIGCQEMENKIYLFPWRINDLLLLVKENLTIECVKIKNEEKFYKECMNDMLSNGMSIVEDSHMSVDRYMKWVLSVEKHESKQGLKKGNSIFYSINGRDNEYDE